MGKIQSRLRCETVSCGTPEVNHIRDTDERTCSSICKSCVVKCCVKRKIKPSEKSKIVIPHNSTDTTNYDDFGAYLCTVKEHRKDGSIYYRHFLEDVDTYGPAGQMGFDSNDEIAALNEEFVPELTHKEVLALFRNVKMDGKTSLTMVTRRHQAEVDGKWIETSATLVPGGTVGRQPVVEHLKIEESKCKTVEVPESKHLYKVPGTQQYLNIFNGQVSFDTLNHCDRTNTICRRAKYECDYGGITYKAALSDETMQWYIGVVGEAVVVKEEPVWFKMTTSGRSTYHFQFQGKYLGYKLRGYEVSREVKVQLSKCGFEQYTPECKYEDSMYGREHRMSSL